MNEGAVNLSDRPIIACVDDDPFIGEALEAFLRSLGYAALIFGSAEEFLRFPRIEDLSCLITDMKLGGMTGLQLLKQLAVDGHAIPAIVITAFGDEPLRTQSLAAGAIGLLNKPIHEGELLALLDVALGRSSP